jgi:ribosome maturation factor RimP
VTDTQERLGRVEAVLAPVLEAHGLELVDIDWRREGRRWVLRFAVDKAGGVGIADCQRFSHEAGDVLDVAGVIEESYDLEVSSPGLDRELRKDRELSWAVGKEVRCWVREPVEGRLELAGRLADVTPESLVISTADGQRLVAARGVVNKVKLVPDIQPRRTDATRR